MIVTYVHSKRIIDQSRVQIRCKNAADAINRTGIHRAYLLDLEAFAQNSQAAQTACASSNLIVIHRYLYDSILSAIQYWKARDKTVIVDFDQSIEHLRPDMPAYLFWHKGQFEDRSDQRIDPPPIEQFRWGLSMVDAATVASERLEADWSRSANVFHIPDYINTNTYPALREKHNHEIWIGLGNRILHESPPNENLTRALETICKKISNIKIAFCKTGAQRKINIPRSQQIQVNTWMELLPRLDIGLLPTQHDYEFRFGYADPLEFMISKIPFLASGETPYTKISAYGNWTENHSTAWESALFDMIYHLEEHQQRASKSPLLFALNQDIHINVERILKTYANLIR